MDVPEVLGDAVELLEAEDAFQPLILPLGEYLMRALDLFSDTFAAIMGVPILQFFAVFGGMWVSFSLVSYLVRSGKALAH
jgi:hypothetical protein